jgi:catalase
MLAAATPRIVAQAALAGLGPNFLEQDLKQRLGRGALNWHLVVTVAGSGDQSNDATKEWPSSREHLEATAEVKP